MKNSWLRQPTEAEIAAGNGILTTRKILRTRQFDLHLMEAGDGILRVAFTGVGKELPVPTLGIRPELSEALAAVAASEPYVVDIAEFEQSLEARYEASAAGKYVKRIIMGDFSCVWDGITLTIQENVLEGALITKISDICIGENPSCKFNRLGSHKVYGCGEKYGWINKIGTTTSNWNTDVMGKIDLHHGLQKEYHTAIPFFISEIAEDRGFTGYYVDNSWRTAFDFDKGEQGFFSFSAEGGALDLYVFHGLSVGEVVRKYGLVTGTMPMPRLDFLGFQQCRWSYMDQKEVLEIATDMRLNDIPCDVLYLDIDYMKDYKVFTVDRKRFPDFKGMNDKLKEMGFKTVAIVDPGVKVEKGYDVYERGLKQGAYVLSHKGEPYVGEVWPGNSVYPDFLNEKTRAWWGQEHDILFREGVDGIWNDMNEPADFTTVSKTIPETCIHQDDDGKPRQHSEVHNLYAAYEAKATFDYMCEKEGQQRPFVLTRSAFAGTQRYAAIWTGDNTSLWEHMESAIPMLLNLGLSGYAYAGGDIGGFQHDSDGEMLARWTQLGAFMPLFRNHSAKDTLYQEPWRFGDEILNITRAATELRYSLLTYLYQQMRISHIKGDAVMRPLFYNGKNDKASKRIESGADVGSSDLWNINDQFLYGPDLMVCPVLRPKLTKRMVYFPTAQEIGCEQGIDDAVSRCQFWYDWQTGERIQGGQWHVVDAPLNKIPVYVREGTILPVDPVRTHIKSETAFERLTFEIYGAETGAWSKGSATFCFDDGLTHHGAVENSVEMRINYEVKTDGRVTVSTEASGKHPLPELSFVWKGQGVEKTIVVL